MYEKGNTVYALTKDQMTDLPSKEWHYRLRYLRPSDIEEYQRTWCSLTLSPGTGLVNYEPKTNTVIVIDTPQRISTAWKAWFKAVDRPQGQIVVEVKILSVNSTAVSRLWALTGAATLGANRLGLGMQSRTSVHSSVQASGSVIDRVTSTELERRTATSSFLLSSSMVLFSALNEGKPCYPKIKSSGHHGG